MILIVVFQALEGSRELENILGVSHSSCVLSAELQKNQELGEEAIQCIYLFIPLEHLPRITADVPSGTQENAPQVSPSRDIKARQAEEGKPGKATPFLMEMVSK